MKKTSIIVAILLMVIGFAAVSTTLFINGQVNVGANIKNFDIYFSEAIVDGEDVSNEVIDSTKKIITYETKSLSLKDETSVLDFEVTNNSTQYDADVKITCTIDQTSTYKNLVTVTTDQPSYVIPAQTRKNGTVTVTLKDTYVETTPAQVTFECELIAEAKSLNALVADAIDDTTTYDLEGILKDKDGNILPKTDIVVYSNTPHVVKTDRNGYFYVSGLEKGRHEIYLKTDADVNDKEATASASSFGATITTNKVYKVTKGEYQIDTYDIAEELTDKSSYCEYDEGKVWNFDYNGTDGSNGSKQVFNVSYECSGIYKLETWGAQGGSADETYYGGYGAYSTGNISLSNTDVFIYVGGAGRKNISSTAPGGYNGGGYTYETRANTYEGSGGGATHMALKDGLLSTLSNSIDSILIVSGGGGGGSDSTGENYYDGIGGNGGGYIGNTGYSTTTSVKNGFYYGTGGSQNSPGMPASHEFITADGSPYGSTRAGFGIGGFTLNANALTWGQSGGGGGFYGGGVGIHGGAGGGSGYIGNPLLTNKAMYCYNCTPSDGQPNEEQIKTYSNTCVDSTPKEKCSKIGNGYARITLISLD